VSRLNSTVRGLLIIVAIAVVVTVLQLQVTLVSLLLLAQIAFFLAIAFFLFLVWRERRQEISTWATRSKGVFYGAVALAIANIGAAVLTAYPAGGLQVLVFLAVLAGCGYALFRVWRSEHTYGY
jgi:hypothetical protein